MFDIINFKDKSEDWFTSQEKQHLYLSQEWLTSLATTYNFDIFLIVDKNDNYQTAICKIDDLMGKRIVSLPFSDYIPFYDKDSKYFEALFKCFKLNFPEHKIILKTNQEKGILASPFNLSKEAVYHTINLKSDNLKQSSSFKRGVAQAKKNGLTVRQDKSIEAIERFYDLYHSLRFNKFNIIPQPFSFFEKLWEAMISKNKGIVFEAIYDNKVIASNIVLQTDNCAYYKYGCSDIEHLQLKPNNLLFHDIIAHYKSNGYKTLDLGLSGIGDSYAGLRRWKEGLGGNAHPITNWSFSPKENEAELEQISKNKALIKNLTDAIVEAKLDPEQTSLLSEQLYYLLA